MTHPWRGFTTSKRLIFGVLAIGVVTAAQHHNHVMAGGQWLTTYDAHVHLDRASTPASTESIWIEAYFARSQLPRVSVGQPANIKVNGLHSLFEATVNSIEQRPGEMPPERRRVTLLLKDGQPGEERLLPGMSAIVLVNAGDP